VIFTSLPEGGEDGGFNLGISLLETVIRGEDSIASVVFDCLQYLYE
jgi:hypothetical protein